ncbi:hypothetical protein WA588_003458 [Blastocystis sp. NMH]
MPEVRCFHCNQYGHLQKDCPQLRGRSNQVCYRCGGVGHIAAVCPSQTTVSRNMYGKVNHGYNERTRIVYPGEHIPSRSRTMVCYNCGKVGHMAKDCRLPPRKESHAKRENETEKESSTTTPHRIICHNCHKEGHLMKDCPEPLYCRRCGKTDHLVADCHEAVQCSRCMQMGHFAKDCPNAVVCFICGKSGHTRDNCPNKEE